MKGFSRWMILILLACFSILVNAQVNFKPGRIITLNNDTISGLINDGGWIRNSKYCLFKENKDLEQIQYFPDDIIAYEISEDKVYISREISNGKEIKTCFLEVLLKGELSLYFYYNTSFPQYYIENQEGDLIGLTNQDNYNAFLQYEYPPNWRAYKIGSSVYKDTLFYLFQDCIPVLNQLDIVEYNHKSLQNITNDYLDLTCDVPDCISYIKDIRKSGPTFGFYSGVQLSKIYFYKYWIISEITPSLPIGIFYNIPISIFTENLSVQFEILYNSINYNKDFLNRTNDYKDLKIKTETIGIPLLVKYKYPLKKITPSLGVGKETAFVIDSKTTFKTRRFNSEGILEFGEVDYWIQKFQKGGWFVDLGLDYEINEDISFYSNFRFKHHLNLIIPDEHYNYYSFTTAEKNSGGTKYISYSAALQIGLRFR
jgi:hypothetical protein